MMLYLRLMYEFFKTGLFAIGGGLATLPFLYEMSEATGWFTRGDIMNLIAVSESTPGAIGINMSTYVGFITAGLPGAILATLALAVPSVVVIILISKMLDRFKGSPVVEGIFKGLRPASTALITAAGLSVAQLAFFHDFDWSKLSLEQVISNFRWETAALALVIYVALKKFKGHPIFYIAAAAVVGIVFKF